VFDSQEKVDMAKGQLTHWRAELRDQRQFLQQVQEQIVQIRNKLDYVPRSDERFLVLATREHQLLKQESESREKCNTLEKREREEFVRLYEAVNESHEQERAYTNRTKYWSVIGSVTGTLIGVIGSSLLNWRRNMLIREVIQEHSDEIKFTGREQAESMALALDRQRRETLSRLSGVEENMGYFREQLTKQSDLLGDVPRRDSTLYSIVSSGIFGAIFGLLLSKVFS
jgi:hypothetical protein